MIYVRYAGQPSVYANADRTHVPEIYGTQQWPATYICYYMHLFFKWGFPINQPTDIPKQLGIEHQWETLVKETILIVDGH